MKIRLISPTRTAWLALAGIFLLGLALRLYCLDCRSLWFDETASIEVAQRGLKAILTDRFGWMQVQTPLHYLIVWLSIQVVDPTTSAVLVRLPSALAGSLSVLVIYGLGKEMFGRLSGLIAALLLALSAIHLNYSQDVRPYATLTLLTALSVYCLLKADATGKTAWWAAFAATTALNIANSYNVLTLVLPTLASYLLWVLWKRWRGKNVEGQVLRGLVAPALSMAFIGVAALPALADLLQVPRTAPDWKQISAVSLQTSVTELASWFTQFGADSSVERLLQAVFLVVAAIGTYAALRPLRSGVFLCWLFMIIPPILLSILGTTNVVYQRYALFTMVFYFLLIGNGIAGMLSAMWSAARGLGAPSPVLKKTLAAVIIIFFSLPFIYSAYNYGEFGQSSGYTQSSLVNKPDLRAASAYLARYAKPADAVIFAGWDATVSDFYWRGARPAAVYSALDPELFTRQAKGSLYWVVTLDLPQEMATDPHWVELARFKRVVLFRDTGLNVNLGASMKWFVEELGKVSNPDRQMQQATDTLRGGVYQAQDQVPQAVAAYRAAGTLFPIGSEYLRTARGFASRNEPDKAWRDALMSKSMQPESPELHQWLAGMLNNRGMKDEARVETEIAAALQARTIGSK